MAHDVTRQDKDKPIHIHIQAVLQHRAKQAGKQAGYKQTHLLAPQSTDRPTPSTLLIQQFTMSGASGARKTWELENKVAIVDPTKDNIYGFDKTEQEALRDAQPWKKE